MSVYSGAVLSSSANGRPIPVTGTATGSANTIHTGPAGTVSFDEVYLWASNVTTAAATLTIEWGGTTDPGDHLIKAYSVPPSSLPVPIALGQRIQGNVLVKAFSGTAGAINITGYVNQVR